MEALTGDSLVDASGAMPTHACVGMSYMALSSPILKIKKGPGPLDV
jgi:hypothetical protein